MKRTFRTTLHVAGALLSCMLPCAAAQAAVPLPPSHATGFSVNVLSCGARGDGAADDQAAIDTAVKAVARHGGGVLYFPAGVYRCARQNAPRYAIEFAGVSNVGIVFEPGAVLLMDNLNPSTGEGDVGGGISFRGHCSNIGVTNADVRWKTRPSKRSVGDGFHFVGYPSDDRTISNIRLVNCAAAQCPQAGAYFGGCSDIQVQDFRVEDNLADGMHFNACRRVSVAGETGVNTGDDTLAFVTYHDPRIVAVTPDGPFDQPALGDWNNSNSVATNIVSRGGDADGVRISGGLQISLSNVVVEGKSCGIVIDSGQARPPRFGWGYLASRGINISNATAIDCDTGFFVWDFDVSRTPENQMWWKYDVQMRGLIAACCRNDSVHVWNAAGVSISDVRAHDRRVRLQNCVDSSISGLDLDGASLVLTGNDDVPAGDSNDRTVGVDVRDTTIRGGSLVASDCDEIRLSAIRISNSPESGLVLSRVSMSDLAGIRISTPNRSAQSTNSGLSIQRCADIVVNGLHVEQDAVPLRSIEIGGGDAQGVSRNIRIESATYCNDGDGNDPGIVIQSSPYAPVNLSLDEWYLNRKAANAGWKKY